MAEPPSRVWALLGHRAGDNDQVIALAEAIGVEYETKKLTYNALNRLGPGLLDRSLVSLTASSPARVLAERPPDLTISTGHRSVPVVRALQRRSGGKMRSIHIGFPRISPIRFDLVIATPQYPIAEHPRVLRIPYALTAAALTRGTPAGWPPADLPSPRALLLVGGPTLYWRLDEAKLFGTLAGVISDRERSGGSVMVTTSARTPGDVTARLSAMLSRATVPTLIAQPGESPGYGALVRAADCLWVTADSVSMTSDAIWTGKAAALVPIAKSPLGRLVFGLMDRIRPGRPVYPEDLRRFWQALVEIGLGEEPQVPRTSTDDVLRTITDRCRAVMDAIVLSSPAKQEKWPA